MHKINIIKPVLMTLVIYTIFFADLLWYFNGDITCLIQIGETYTTQAELPDNLCVHKNQNGYDGQFYYRFALNPFSNSMTENGIAIDQPVYRYQRILFPVLTWMISLGNTHAVPYVMVFINLLSICVLAAFAATFALSNGRNSHWALIISLYVGFLIVFAHNLIEILEAALLFGAYLTARKKPFLTAFLLSCAILTRETALLAALAVVAAAFIQRWSHRWAYLIPCLVYVIWQSYITWFWGNNSLTVLKETASYPFAGLVSAFQSALLNHDRPGLIFLIVIVLISLLFLVVWFRSKAPLHIRLAWLLYSALACTLMINVWGDFISYVRVLSEWYLFGCMLVIQGLKIPALHKLPFRTPSIQQK